VSKAWDGLMSLCLQPFNLNCKSHSGLLMMHPEMHSVEDILQLSPASLPLSDDCSTGNPAAVSSAGPCTSQPAGMVCKPSTSDQSSRSVVSLRPGLEGHYSLRLSGRMERCEHHVEADEVPDLFVLGPSSSNSPSDKVQLLAIKPRVEVFRAAQGWLGEERWASVKDCESSLDHADTTHMSFEDESRIDPLVSADSTSGLSFKAVESRPPTLGDWPQVHPGHLASRYRSYYWGPTLPTTVPAVMSRESKMRARSKSTSFNNHDATMSIHQAGSAAAEAAAVIGAPTAGRHPLRQSMVLMVGCNVVEASDLQASSNCKRSQTLQGERLEALGQAGVSAPVGGHASVQSCAPTTSSRSSLPVWLSDSPEYGACSSSFDAGEIAVCSSSGTRTPSATFNRDLYAQPFHLRHQQPESGAVATSVSAHSPYIHMYDLMALQNSLAAPLHHLPPSEQVV
jgi:hypothetical protein